MLTRRLFPAIVLTLLCILLVPGLAQAKVHRCGSRVIKTALGPTRLYFKATRGVRCRTAHRVIRRYFSMPEGSCKGSGCFIRLPSGWECMTAPASVEVKYGEVTRCSKRGRWILTSRYPNRGFHPTG
jgi:hypothetical protein